MDDDAALVVLLKIANCIMAAACIVSLGVLFFNL